MHTMHTCSYIYNILCIILIKYKVYIYALHYIFKYMHKFTFIYIYNVLYMNTVKKICT